MIRIDDDSKYQQSYENFGDEVVFKDFSSDYYIGLLNYEKGTFHKNELWSYDELINLYRYINFKIDPMKYDSRFFEPIEFYIYELRGSGKNVIRVPLYEYHWIIGTKSCLADKLKEMDLVECLDNGS